MKVEITCRQVVEYSKTVEMSKRDYKKFMALNDDEIYRNLNPEEFGILEGYLTGSDIIGTEDFFSMVYVSPVKKEGGEPS